MFCKNRWHKQDRDTIRWITRKEWNREVQLTRLNSSSEIWGRECRGEGISESPIVPLLKLRLFTIWVAHLQRLIFRLIRAWLSGCFWQIYWCYSWCYTNAFIHFYLSWIDLICLMFKVISLEWYSRDFMISTKTSPQNTRPQWFKQWMALSTGWITIQWISDSEINCAIHSIVIYPVDSVIHFFWTTGARSVAALVTWYCKQLLLLGFDTAFGLRTFFFF